ncbi:MAG: pilus assembly protein PilZ [Betaproteobacteria bacterium]|nr:pilus assembly protein PilZ [Betaproteobacteria bacterium]
MSQPNEKSDVAPRTTALSLNIKDLSILHAAFMPYVKHGGIFIPTNKPYVLGDEIFMLIALPGDAAKIPVAGRVVWITPPGAQGNKAHGVGVQFKDDDSGRQARQKIEALLAGYGKANQPTHTM